MDLIKIISELRKERAVLDAAIAHMEQFARAQSGDGIVGKISGRKRKPFTEVTRKKMAAAQKKRWAAARAAAKSS